MYRSEELFYWLEPMLTDEEFAIGEQIQFEARALSRLIPTGDHWA